MGKAKVIVPKVKPKPKNKSEPEQEQHPPFQLDEEGAVMGTDGTRVWLSFHKTIQIKDFHPFGATAGAITNVREGETILEALNRISPELKVKVKSELLKAKKEN